MLHVHLQWNITQPYKIMKQHHLQHPDGPRDYILSEVSQIEKLDKYHMIPLTCRILKKMIQVNLFIKQKQTLKTNMG